MSARATVLLLGATLRACAASGEPGADGAEQGPVTPSAKPCFERIDVSKSTSLDTVPIDASGMSDFPKLVRAEPVDLRHVPEPRLADIRLADRPVFFAVDERDANGRRSPTVVDGDLFGDLTCVDATRVRAGQTYRVGDVRGDARYQAPQQIASALIRAGVIRAFVHMEASLCLVHQENDFPEPPLPSSVASAEAETNQGWTGRYEGTHTFFTNTKNVSPVAFLVHIARGTIYVEGL